MKPDLHKQKKSTLYKKKHGIPAKNESNEIRSDKRKNDSHSSDKESVSKDERNNVENKTEAASNVANSSKSYRKREITSNWSKYEISADEINESEFQSGSANYSELVNIASDALSQFRFKDELTWEDNNSDLLIEDFMTFDLNDLSKVLKCIPLHERLDIDKKLFTNEQIESFNYEARKLREHLYTLNEKTEPSVRLVLEEDNDDETIENVESIESPETEQITESSIPMNLTVEDDILEEVLSKSDLVIVKETSQVSDKAICSFNNTEQNNLNFSYDNEKHEKDFENDLEDLLSLNPFGNNSNNKALEEKPGVSDAEISEDVCEDLKRSEDAQPDHPKVFKPSTTENLEDWLDDLLG